MTSPRRSFRAHVQAVQAELAESTKRGGLATDAYGRVIEAQSAAIGVFPDFVDAVKSAQPQFTAGHITAISDNLYKAINPTVTEAIRRLDWKMTAFYTALALVLIGMAGVGGYYQGRADGYEAGYYVSQNKMVDITLGTTVAATLPAPKAEQWLRLIHLNGEHIDEAWDRCIASQQEGRMACEFPFWITSPPVPHIEQAAPPPTTPKKAGSK
jgi:hypothetical protein